MPKNLKRYYGRGDLHFLTFSCYRRLPLLRTVRARNLFVQALGMWGTVKLPSGLRPGHPPTGLEGQACLPAAVTLGTAVA